MIESIKEKRNVKSKMTKRDAERGEDGRKKGDGDRMKINAMKRKEKQKMWGTHFSTFVKWPTMER